MSWLSLPKFRKLFFQAITVLLVVLIAGFLLHNVSVNLARLGQNIDFSFLQDSAGFDVSQSLIAYQSGDSYARVFVVGLLNTLLISALATITATLLGVLIGVLRLSPNWLVSKLTAAYVDIFRNIPLLLQLFFWYFAVLSVLPSPRASTLTLGCTEAAQGCLLALTNRGLSMVRFTGNSPLLMALLLCAFGAIVSYGLSRWNRQRQRQTGKLAPLAALYGVLILAIPLLFFFLKLTPQDYTLPALKGFNYQGGVTILPELVALWLALTLYSAAYIAEYVRAGVQAVPRGQYEAAASIGLSDARMMRLIILPQALRVIIPPLTNQYLNIVKNSSLATAIAYPDLVSVFTGTALTQSGRAIEIILITMAVYLSISLLIALIMNLYNRHVQLKER